MASHRGQNSFDLASKSVDALVDAEEIERRKAKGIPPIPESETPWQAIYRDTVGSLRDGAAIESAIAYGKTSRKIPRHSQQLVIQCNRANWLKLLQPVCTGGYRLVGDRRTGDRLQKAVACLSININLRVHTSTL